MISKFKKTIKFFLYNYKNINDYISKREEDIIDRINPSLMNWSRGILTDTNTCEECAIQLSEDIQISRYKEWKELINEILLFFCKNDILSYKFLSYKYFDKKTPNQIKELLKINYKQQIIIDSIIIKKIEESALKRKIK